MLAFDMNGMTGLGHGNDTGYRIWDMGYMNVLMTIWIFGQCSGICDGGVLALFMVLVGDGSSGGIWMYGYSLFISAAWMGPLGVLRERALLDEIGRGMHSLVWCSEAGNKAYFHEYILLSKPFLKIERL